MQERDADPVRGKRGLVKVEHPLRLKAGKYELYYFGGASPLNVVFNNGDGSFLEGLIELFSGKTSRRHLRRYLRDCYVAVSSDDLPESALKTFKVTGVRPGALLVRNRLGDSQYVKWGFTLDRPMSLHIYSLFEMPRGYRKPVDYGWIVNVDTHERVWELDRWESHRAGGGSKNRVFDDDVRFDAGTYTLYFVTDDSHSFDGFNVNPPYDPYNWGIQVLPGHDFKKSTFHEVEPAPHGKPLIDFSRARNNDEFEQAFRLTRPATLYIYAIGEYGSGGEFVDYGWIEDANTGRVVWEMTRENTEYAGGAEKNRMFDGNVNLPAGEYIANYVTDDSHAYRDWNSAPPFDPRAWGMTIYPGKGFSPSAFTKLSMSELARNSHVLVALTKVGDDERRRAKFTLDKDAWVRVYAIGEGSGGEMYDYGWIIDDETGRDVWEMRYEDTRHAGGASKNRMVDDTIRLKAGTYVVYYITDGSHAFGDWNATRPRDYRHWGITVTLADHAPESF
ncbi:MAG: hypothetical protein D6800_13870 [Candidatus Zixiibacteriota bacterium]|nr:MAG: hypothetical protein D6800_13870 [candidate division Zixibacteria bacterium]